MYCQLILPCLLRKFEISLSASNDRLNLDFDLGEDLKKNDLPIAKTTR